MNKRLYSFYSPYQIPSGFNDSDYVFINLTDLPRFLESNIENIKGAQFTFRDRYPIPHNKIIDPRPFGLSKIKENLSDLLISGVKIVLFLEFPVDLEFVNKRSGQSVSKTNIIEILLDLLRTEMIIKEHKSLEFKIQDNLVKEDILRQILERYSYEISYVFDNISNFFYTLLLTKYDKPIGGYYKRPEWKGILYIFPKIKNEINFIKDFINYLNEENYNFVRNDQRKLQHEKINYKTKISENDENLESNGDLNMENSDLNKRKVFVIQGRNENLNKAIISFLRSLNLEPMEWNQMIDKPTPFIYEVVKNGFNQVQAFVIILSPDEECRIIPPLNNNKEDIYDFRPRPNVIFEAGMALGMFPERTIIIQSEYTNTWSDIDGFHVVRLDKNTWQNDLRTRLLIAKCEIKDRGNDWLGTYDVSLSKEISDYIQGRKENKNKGNQEENDLGKQIKERILLYFKDSLTNEEKEASEYLQNIDVSINSIHGRNWEILDNAALPEEVPELPDDIEIIFNCRSRKYYDLLNSADNKIKHLIQNKIEEFIDPNYDINYSRVTFNP